VIGTISVVDPIIDAASGTFSVRLDLPNPDGGIPGGLHCTVKFLED
jgi:multidrug efflux pump subunit AcrA (membrane-fusion protein)